MLLWKVLFYSAKIVRQLRGGLIIENLTRLSREEDNERKGRKDWIPGSLSGRINDEIIFWVKVFSQGLGLLVCVCVCFLYLAAIFKLCSKVVWMSVLVCVCLAHFTFTAISPDAVGSHTACTCTHTHSASESENCHNTIILWVRSLGIHTSWSAQHQTMCMQLISKF